MLHRAAGRGEADRSEHLELVGGTMRRIAFLFALTTLTAAACGPSMSGDDDDDDEDEEDDDERIDED